MDQRNEPTDRTGTRGSSRPILLAVLALLALVAALVAWRTWPWQAPPSPLPLTIARLQAPHSGMLEIAQAKGYFADEGLTVTLKAVPTGFEAIGQVMRGEVDVGTAAETPIARALAEGTNVKVIATIFSSQWNSAVVARGERGIREPRDLAGKKIGFVPVTATHYMLEAFLAFHSIDLGAVTLLPMPPDRLTAAMIAGEVDAASIWNPFLSKIRQSLGASATVFTPKDFYFETFNLVVRPGYVQQHRPEIDRLLRALLKAEAFAAKNAQETVRIVADAAKMDPSALSSPEQPLAYELSLQQPLYLAVENEVRWFFRRGLVPSRAFPDLPAAFETDPLRSVKPASMTISR